MLVYMLLNTVTERCYVGATSKTLEARWKSHKDDAASGSTYPLHRAMREWDIDDLWLCVVLCNAYDSDELCRLEEAWIELTSARDPAVGYNGNSVPYTVSAANGRLGGRPSPPHTKPQSALAGMTQEQMREYFRECGKRGAKPKAEMSEEERERYREWGRKGAQRAKERQANR